MNITMLAKSGAFINLIDLLMLTGLFFAFILAAFSGRIFSTPIRNFVIMMIVVYGLLKPTSDVMIIDERSGKNYNVSNVPLGVALFGYFQSSLSRDLVNFFENSLNSGQFYASYAKYGFGFGPFSTKAIVEYMNSPAISNQNPEYGRLVTNLSKFSQECFGYSAAQGNNNMALMAIKAMPASNDAFKIFLGQDPNYPYINSGLTMDYLNSSRTYESLNCKDAGSRIYADVKSFINSSQLDQNFVKQVQGMLSANPTSLATDLQTALQYHFNSLSQLENLKMNILFSSMAYDFVKLGASGLSSNADVSNYAVNSILGSAKMSAIQQAVENFGQGAVAVALAPKMLNFTKMMYYLLFFVLLTLALTPLARAIGKVVLVFVVFLTGLEHMNVLLNYLLNTMAYYQASSSTTCNNSPAGILSCLDINSLFYTNILNFSILGLIGLAYMLASAMVTGSGAVIGAIGDKFGTGAITYQGANNNIGSLSNFVNDPLKQAAAQGMNTGSFIVDGGSGFQSSLANYMSATAVRKGIEAGQYATNWDQMRNATTYATWTDKFNTTYENAKIDKLSNVNDFSLARGTTSQLIASFLNSGDASLAKMAAGLQVLKDAMGGRDILMTVKKNDNGYTIEYDMTQLGKKGKESITVGKDGTLIQGSIDTGRGLIMIDHGKVKIGEQDITSALIGYQQQFQEKMAVNIGRALAEKLGLNVSKETAKVIGNTFMKAKSWDDFKQKLNDIINTDSDKSGNRHDKKDEKTKEKKKTEKDDVTTHESLTVGTQASFGTNPFTTGISITAKAEAGASHSHSNQSENSERTSNTESDTEYTDKSKTKETKDAEGTGYREGLRKELQHFVQDMEKNSKTLSKSFDDIKQETYQKAYEETRSAFSAQEIAQRIGIELTPEALQKLSDAAAYAAATGDSTAFIRAMGEISNDSRYWLGKDVKELNNLRQNIAQNYANTVNNVAGQTKEVPGKIEGVEKAAILAEILAKEAEKLNTKGPNVNTKDTIPEPTQPPPKKENPAPIQPQQSPQQPVQQRDPETENIIRYIKEQAGPAGNPIKGQPTIKDMVSQGLNPQPQSSSNLFTPIYNRVKTPEAPGPGKVNSRGGNNNKTDYKNPG